MKSEEHPVVNVQKWYKHVKAAGATKGLSRMAHISKITSIQSTMSKAELRAAEQIVSDLTLRELKSLWACGVKKELRKAVLDTIADREADRY